MRKIFALTFLILILLCGCNPGSNSDSTEVVSVILPDAETATTVNGYLIAGTTVSEDSTRIEYYVNKNTKKFHLNSCRWATSIKEENLYKSYNRGLLISDGYEPCKTCEP